ncbi:hypothetical protein BDF20DRAFT_900746 [Mycotypha africana]|uniref:uncharacterized protein n=1 Tax=Mycotypha africana TaxID=64632 RepID=UPI0023007C99|nr:uncharacterized protein BDF20DRAFT_900746 [Mycotypha africana]KAI8967375.1 hypothetical protein BDF20DRAFT_900746 [Mycotypha africana]
MVPTKIEKSPYLVFVMLRKTMTAAFNIHNLPVEIIELIAFYTTKQDLLQVLRVSKAWYHYFHAFLYQSITIDTVKRQHTLLKHFQTCQTSRYHVRQLELKHIQLTADDVSALTVAFPHIDSLVIHWSIWDSLLNQMYHSPYEKQHERSSIAVSADANSLFNHIHPSQGLAPILRHFFQFYGSKNLKHLTLDTSPHCVPNYTDNNSMSNLATITTTHVNTSSVDVWFILQLCPRLKTLNLRNLNYEHLICMGYLEVIHQYCPLLTSLSIKCARCDASPHLLPQYNDSRNEEDIAVNNYSRIDIQPSILESFTLSSKAGCAKWASWLPYFAVKYPHLQHLMFKHRGLGKDGGGGHSRIYTNTVVPEQVFELFVKGCRQLKSIHWNKIIVQPNQLDSLFESYSKRRKDMMQQCSNSRKVEYDQPQLQKVEAYGCLQTMQTKNLLYLELLTSLTIGQPPAHYTTTQVIASIGQQCQRLTKLTIQECFCDQELAYPVDIILTHCKQLRILSIKDTHLITATSTPSPLLLEHPLKKLYLKRSSFTSSVFPTIANLCLRLSHVELLGCVQTDRRDQIRIALPYQNLTTLKVQGLRTRQYYSGCRIRFFHIVDHSIPTEQQHHWHYMTRYDVRNHPVGHKLCFQKYRHMEYAQQFDPLYTTIEQHDTDDKTLTSIQRRKSSCIIQELIESLAIKNDHTATATEQQEQQIQADGISDKRLKAWDIQQLVKKTAQYAATMKLEDWEPESIYYSGFAHLEYASVKDLYINQKKLILDKQ